jgi:Tfp pilus assembly protein PilP
VPDEVALRGIVRSNGSIIAVVTTKENRAYFLRENDPVLNGVVTRITEGSITFREKTTDIFGKQSQREVVKKINPAAA